MPTPMPIGRIRYTVPRGVEVREAGDVKSTHSAVHGTIAVYTDSSAETQAVIENWEDIMYAVNHAVNGIIVTVMNQE